MLIWRLVRPSASRVISVEVTAGQCSLRHSMLCSMRGPDASVVYSSLTDLEFRRQVPIEMFDSGFEYGLLASGTTRLICDCPWQIARSLEVRPSDAAPKLHAIR